MSTTITTLVGSDQARDRAIQRRFRHMSRNERQRAAQTTAFSRRAQHVEIREPRVTLSIDEQLLAEELLLHDRTPVSTALLAIGGVGAGDARKRVVLRQLEETAAYLEAQGALSTSRAQQIARHITKASSTLAAPRPQASKRPQRDAAADERSDALLRAAAELGIDLSGVRGAH